MPAPSSLVVSGSGLARRHSLVGGFLDHPSGLGSSISEALALGVDTVYACVRLIADIVAGSDVGEWKGNALLPSSRLTLNPGIPPMTRREWLWLVAATLALYNRAPYRRGPLDSEGVPYWLEPIYPARLTRSGSTLYLDGEAVEASRFGIIHRAMFPATSGDVSTVLRLARAQIGAAAAAVSYTSEWWEAGGAPMTVLKSDAPIENDKAVEMAERWAERRLEGPGLPAVLSDGLDVSAFGADLGSEAADAAGDRLAAAVARYFGVPPDKVNVRNQASSLTYSTTEMAGTDLIRYTALGYTEAIGDRVSTELPGHEIAGRRIRVDPSLFTRADQLSRYQAWAIALDPATGWMDVDEVREREGLPPRERVPVPAPIEVPA
jgi:HK97 family phage portal protein